MKVTWGTADCHQLTEMWKAGLRDDIIAKALNRTTKAIEIQRSKMGLTQDNWESIAPSWSASRISFPAPTDLTSTGSITIFLNFKEPGVLLVSRGLYREQVAKVLGLAVSKLL